MYLWKNKTSTVFLRSGGIFSGRCGHCWRSITEGYWWYSNQPLTSLHYSTIQTNPSPTPLNLRQLPTAPYSSQRDDRRDEIYRVLQLWLISEIIKLYEKDLIFKYLRLITGKITFKIYKSAKVVIYKMLIMMWRETTTSTNNIIKSNHYINSDPGSYMKFFTFIKQLIYNLFGYLHRCCFDTKHLYLLF